MGNSFCRGEESSTAMVWPHSIERQSLLAGDHHHNPTANFSSSSHSDNNAYREVKIKIAKKELEEMLEKAEVRGMSMDQLLARLINVAHDYDDHDYFETNNHQRSWRPVLQTIPEVN